MMKEKIFLLPLICGIIFQSCHTKENKFVQAEFDKIIGTWEVQSFNVTGSAPDSLKIFFKSGVLLFKKCDYKKKNFNLCSGELELNGIVFDNTYRYDYSAKLFKFNQVGAYGEKPSELMIRTVINGNLLLYGDWELTVADNILTAKQVRNVNKIGDEVSFVAKRK